MIEAELFLMTLVFFVAIWMLGAGLFWLLGPTVSIILMSFVLGWILALALADATKKAHYAGGLFCFAFISTGLSAYNDQMSYLPMFLCLAVFVGVIVAKKQGARRWWHWWGGIAFSVVLTCVHFAVHVEKETAKAAERAAKIEARAKAAAERCERPIFGRLIKLAGGCDP